MPLRALPDKRYGVIYPIRSGSNLHPITDMGRTAETTSRMERTHHERGVFAPWRHRLPGCAVANGRVHGSAVGGSCWTRRGLLANGCRFSVARNRSSASGCGTLYAAAWRSFVPHVAQGCLIPRVALMTFLEFQHTWNTAKMLKDGLAFAFAG